MNIDVLSLLMGKALGSGGGGEGGSDLAVWNGGFFGRDEMAAAASITVTIDGFNGKYALITVAHRDDLTTPDGCTLLDKTTFVDSNTTQYVSAFKHFVSAASESIEFQQASSKRISATVWVFDSDFSIEKSDTKTESTNIYSKPFEVTTNALSFITFNSIYAQQSESNREWPVSDGAWLCADVIPGRTIAHYYCRFFTGIIPPSASDHTVHIGKYTDNSGSLTAGVKAQLVVYTVSKA